MASEDLTKEGVLVFNVIGTYDDWRSDIVGSMYQTLKSVFPHVYHFQASDTRNMVMLAVKSKEPLTSTTLKNKVARFAGRAAEVAEIFWASRGPHSGSGSEECGECGGVDR